MAVILRETLNIYGKEYPDRKIYKSSSGLVTKADEEKADELDRLIEEKVKEAKYVVAREGLVRRKGKKGVLKLWYTIGKALQFVGDPSVVSPEDRQFILEAIWYHMEKQAPELIPGEQIKRRGTYRDHFSQCYKLARFPWGAVEKGGNWSNWQEFFDSETDKDERILTWILRKTRKEKILNNWLKTFYRDLKKRVSGKVTTVFTDEELGRLLNEIWALKR